MNFWEKITGSDMTRAMNEMTSRARLLPVDYQAAWEKIQTELMPHTDFTGRNLMPILDGVLDWLEVAAMDGQRIDEVLGDDIRGFCLALVSEEGAKSYRDKWRQQLNHSIAKKLGR